MSQRTRASSESAAEERWASVDSITSAFEDAWRKAPFPSLHAALGMLNEGQRRAVLEELVEIDLEYRWQAGEPRSLDDYAREFPELRAADGKLSPGLIRRARQVKRWFEAEVYPCSATDSDMSLSPQPGGPEPAGDLPRRVGHFELVEVLGRGAFGTVYKARDVQLGRWVAIKMLRAGSFATLEQHRRFLREARSAAELNHPSIVPVHSISHEGEVPYIVSEYIEGTTLAVALDRKRFGFQETATLLALLADALVYAHGHRIVHRDLNPRNVLLDGAGRPHLTDFGLALHQDASVAVTLDGQVLGTPAYMSPEQAAGHSSAVDGRSDVFSLGVILYQMLTSELPFRGTARMLLHQVVHDDPPSPRRLNDRVPYDLETICLKAMAKLPSGRYATAGELAADLRCFLAGETIAARRARWLERVHKWVRRRPMQAIAVLTSSVAAVCLMLAFWYATSLRTTQAIAAAEIQAAREIAATQEYYSRVTRVREARARPSPGWTWSGLANLHRAAQVPTPARNLVELRSEAAACLAAFDLREVATLAKQLAPFCLTFSTDGKRLAIGPLRGGARAFIPLYDLDSRELKRELALPPSSVSPERTGVRSLAFSHDGRWLAAGTREGRIHVWDVGPRANGQAESPLRMGTCASWLAHDDDVLGLAFSPDGAGLVSSSADSTFKRWKPSAGWREVSRLQADRGLNELVFSRDGRIIVCGGRNEMTFVDTVPFTIRAPDRQPVGNVGNHHVASSPDGQMLAASDGWEVVLIDAHDNRVIRTLRDPELSRAHEDDVEHLSFSAEGTLLVSGAQDRKIKVWEVASGQRLVAITALGVGNVFPEFSPDGRFLAVTGNRQTILYEIAGRRAQTIVGQHPYPVRAIDFAPDGRALACQAEELGTGSRRGPGRGEISVWDLASGQVQDREDIAFDSRRDPRSPVSVAYHPGGGLLAFSYGDGDRKTFRIWDRTSRKRLAPTADWKAASLCFTPDGKTLWTAGHHGNQVASWRLPELTQVSSWSNADSTLGDGRTSVYCVAAGADWVTAGSWDGSVKLFHSLDGTLASVWPCPGGPVLCVGLSRDQQWFAAGAQNGSTYVVRVPNRELVAELKGHHESVDAVAFRGDGSLLATGSRDGTIRLWEWTGGSLQEWLTLPSPSGPVAAVAFSPDGERLACLVRNELAVRIWDLAALRQHMAQMNLGW
jgi:WD40 repeat protein/tRNA A-37 threonylcarbamoyl transferase component Bud32